MAIQDQPRPFINRIPFRIACGLLALILLGAVYLLQRLNVFDLLFHTFHFPPVHPYVVFVFNKTLRLILNDLGCLVIIWAVFQKSNYLRVAWYVFLAEILIVLPLYFVIKLSLEGDSELSSPLLSQIHRMIVNPMLMFLLMAGFIYQNLKAHRE